MAEHVFNWLEHQSAHYKAFIDKWLYVARYDDGTYIDPEHIKTYLIQRKQGESKTLHEDRKDTLSPNLHLSNIFGRTAGQFTQGESKLEHTWFVEGQSGGLGDPFDMKTRAWQIVNDIDGKGKSLALWKSELLHALQVYEEVYVLVQAPEPEHGPIHWRIITPDKVIDHGNAGGVFVKIRHEVERRNRPMDEPKTFVQIDLFTLDGQRRWEWEKDKDKGAEDAEEVKDTKQNLPFEYEFFAQADSPVKRLPLVHSSLAFDRYMAYLMAKKAVAILNHESERNNRLRVAATPKNLYKSMNGPATGVKTPLEDGLAEGGNFAHIKMGEEFSTMEAPVDGVEESSEVIIKETKDLYILGSQSYEDAAVQATATEIRQEENKGPVAVLNLYALRFDPIINTCLLLTEQIEHPGQDNLWGVATATRNQPFSPESNEQAVERDAKALFPKGVPMTEEMFVQAQRQQAEARGPGIQDEKAFMNVSKEQYKEYRMQQLLDQGFPFEVASQKAGLGVLQTDFSGDGL